ncbi:hypothetical protein KKG58_04915 [Patescibacteria group bacterium]|nr:hypothetical protein [Patescibacteria group bacterium]
MNKLYIYLPIIFCLVLFFVFFAQGGPASGGHSILLNIIIGYSLIIILSLVSGIILIKGKIKKRWPILLQIMVLSASALVFFLFLNGIFWQIVFVLFFSGASSFFLFHIWQFFYQPRLCQPEALERMSFWLNFVIIYWVLVGLGMTLGLEPLKGLFFLSLILVFVLFFWMAYYLNFIKGDDFKLIKIDSLIITLVLTEIYLAINFLPLGVYFNALIISILYSIISDTNTLIHTNDANKTYS